eukprot:XP_017948156.1 PREDICTED: zinc metalloproteinase-disintegrin-like batroxstatin-2 [Xenopus tropicalis]
MAASALLFAGLLTCQVLVLQGWALPATQKYEIVYPQILQAQENQAFTSAPLEGHRPGLHHPHPPKGFTFGPPRNRRPGVHPRHPPKHRHPRMLQYELQLDNKPLVLHLEKTEDLFFRDYTETRYLQDGTPTTISPVIKDHCYYQGRVMNDPDSLVSLSTCNGLRGIITTKGRHFLIEPLSASDSEEHALYPYEPQEVSPTSCGVTYNNGGEDEFRKMSSSFANQEDKILRSKKYVQLYVVADNSMYLKYNGSKETIKQRIYEMVNYVNMVYKPLNVFAALCGIEIWDQGDQIAMLTNSKVNLARFSAWREKVLLPRKQNDLAQLITNINFDGPVVGIAYIGMICSTTQSAGVLQDHNKLSIILGATSAHEMGHSLGMYHDGKACACNKVYCLMSTKLSSWVPNTFSTCSINNFQEFLLNTRPTCLGDIPDKTNILTPPVCGNKFTEMGEDCDCGTVQECKDQCCDAATCKLKPGAQCAEGECCSNCKIKAAGEVCRERNDDCDLEDVCDGTSPWCPSDRFQANGAPCGKGEGYCYNGTCPTMQRQCTSLWGENTLVGEDLCFNKNMEGTDYGHCKNVGSTYIPCKPE